MWEYLPKYIVHADLHPFLVVLESILEIRFFDAKLHIYLQASDG